MSINKIPIKDVDLSVVYITISELAREVGMSPEGVRRHLISDVIDGFCVDKGPEDTKTNKGKKIFITPDDADFFRGLIKAGIIEARGKRA